MTNVSYVIFDGPEKKISDPDPCGRRELMLRPTIFIDTIETILKIVLTCMHTLIMNM